MFPASSVQSFGHGCTMPGSLGDSRGQDLDLFIHKWQRSSAVTPGIQLGNADMRKDTCTLTFQTYSVTEGTRGWSSKGFTKAAFGPWRERVEGGEQISLLRGVRAAWPWVDPSTEPHFHRSLRK